MRRSAAGLALGVGLLGAVLLAGCGGSSASGSSVPNGDVAVVDGQDITVADLQTTMNIARLSLKTSFPEPGTEQWVSLRSRALESLAHEAELRAWARNLGVSVKQSAVDAAVKSTLSSAFPGKTAGSIDQAKVDAEFRTTGMTRALLRSRTETKLLAQAAADKVAVSPSVTDAQIKAQYDKDKKTVYTQPERRKLRHILVKDKALADQLYAQLKSSDASFAELAKKYSTDGSKSAGGELGVANRTSLVKPFADVAFALPVGVVSPPTKTQFGWHLIEAEGPVLPASTRPLDVTLKVQIRSQLAQQQRQKSIAQKFNAAQIELSRNIQFAPGYAPPVATPTQ
ncbi:MAG: foldase protein PrsA [Gaiellales bacterium]|jgi:parvulin-like peptidyl-prolyl isomerase|nr:foldase protein PrsA [Gaiellales bacterium]